MVFSFFLSLFFATPSIALSQHLFQKGMDFDDDLYAHVPKKAKLTRSLSVLPKEASIKSFAPFPGDQSLYGTCTSWAAAYCGRTILEAVKNNWTDREFITENAYSPTFLFRMLKPDDHKCNGGSALSIALHILKENGAILHKDLPQLCVPAINDEQLHKATSSKIKDYMRLFEPGSSPLMIVQSVKKAISELKPVVFGMMCPKSFHYAKTLWEPHEQPSKSYGGHAMCVVGYDDQLYGGAFEVQNSWGTSWGNDGYTWIKYDDFVRFTLYAYEFVDVPTGTPELADLAGQIRLVLSDGTDMQTSLLTSTRGLKVVPNKATNGPLTHYKTIRPYSSGTRFRIYITNNEPAYVYAISTDLSHELTTIFPYEEGISAALTDTKNEVAIPDEEYFIEFDQNPGKNFLCVLYSKEELNINDLIEKIAAQKGTFNERVFKVIEDKMVNAEHIRFSKDMIAFEGFSTGKSIVPLMVELDHQ